MAAPTLRALVTDLVDRKLSVEELLAIFLYICGENSRKRKAAGRFQYSTQYRQYTKLLPNETCTCKTCTNNNPTTKNEHITPLEIVNNGRYYPSFKVYTLLCFIDKKILPMILY